MIRGMGICVKKLSCVRRADSGAASMPPGVFTAAEQQEARANGCRKSYYAGRWAAKEAVLQALALPCGGAPLLEIETLGGAEGRPLTRLSGSAAEAMRRMGARRLSITISHEIKYAVASALLE